MLNTVMTEYNDTDTMTNNTIFQVEIRVGPMLILGANSESYLNMYTSTIAPIYRWWRRFGINRWSVGSHMDGEHAIMAVHLFSPPPRNAYYFKWRW